VAGIVVVDMVGQEEVGETNSMIIEIVGHFGKLIAGTKRMRSLLILMERSTSTAKTSGSLAGISRTAEGRPQ
jgi:hypothetical protein